jgi:hypothetical protein
MKKIVARHEPCQLAPWQGAQRVRYVRCTGVAVFGTGWGRNRSARKLPPSNRSVGARMTSSHFAFTRGSIPRGRFTP